mmetsp:Transcript_25132/g.59764  ORF Transcript_25132/g.59764 Transcript_25132/m.59764 type:complete len:250 (-) Transcript_25132:1181-1930(-)
MRSAPSAPSARSSPAATSRAFAANCGPSSTARTPLRTFAVYAAAAAAPASSPPSAAAAGASGAGGGLSTLAPHPRFDTFAALAGWSPKPGQTSTGVPTAMLSMREFCPPFVTNSAGLAARSRSTCGTDAAHTAFFGVGTPASAAGWGPSDTTISGESASAEPSLAPSSSNTARYTDRQSCCPVRPLPSVAPQPCSWSSLVTTVPIETYTTGRPPAAAASTRRISSSCCSWSAFPGWLRFAPVASRSGPT